MARLPRLGVPNQLHLVVHRSPDGQPVLGDSKDLDIYQDCIRDAFVRDGISLHAFSVTPTQVWLLATPHTEAVLGVALQAVGRSFVAGFNRRHGRTGPLWGGRFRSAVVEAEPCFVDCLRFVDAAPVRQGLVERAEDWPWSTAAHHAGLRRVAGVRDHPQWLRLGNTPFERDAAYRTLLDLPLDPNLAQGMERAAWFGWAYGTSQFVEQLAGQLTRRVVPRRRGRPSRTAKQPH
jgi:putative transposase